MKFHALLLFIHLLAAVVWIGGMFFAHICLRPAAMETLEPPLRLRLWQSVFAHFFRWVNTAIGLLVVTGLGMLHRTDLSAIPPGWHVMISLGTVMIAVYVYLRLVPHQTFRLALAANDYAVAASAQNNIRKLVSTNLLLAILVLASITLGLAL